MKIKKAKLIAAIPPERFRSIDGSVPKIGDIVMLDQGFTFPNGEPGCLVYCGDSYDKLRWSGEAYESEIGEDIVS